MATQAAPPTSSSTPRADSPAERARLDLAAKVLAETGATMSDEWRVEWTGSAGKRRKVFVSPSGRRFDRAARVAESVRAEMIEDAAGGDDEANEREREREPENPEPSRARGDEERRRSERCPADDVSGDASPADSAEGTRRDGGAAGGAGAKNPEGPGPEGTKTREGGNPEAAEGAEAPAAAKTEEATEELTTEEATEELTEETTETSTEKATEWSTETSTEATISRVPRDRSRLRFEGLPRALRRRRRLPRRLPRRPPPPGSSSPPPPSPPPPRPRPPRRNGSSSSIGALATPRVACCGVGSCPLTATPPLARPRWIFAPSSARTRRTWLRFWATR
jgi:hypothetical protein